MDIRLVERLTVFRHTIENTRYEAACSHMLSTLFKSSLSNTCLPCFTSCQHTLLRKSKILVVCKRIDDVVIVWCLTLSSMVFKIYSGGQ